MFEAQKEGLSTVVDELMDMAFDSRRRFATMQETLVNHKREVWHFCFRLSRKSSHNQRMGGLVASSTSAVFYQGRKGYFPSVLMWREERGCVTVRNVYTESLQLSPYET